VHHAIYLPPFGSFGDVHALVDLAVAAEEAGWDGFFLWDHIQYADPVPLCDAWVTLAAVAASTSTIRLGPLVTPLPRRRPWKVAREAVTLDHLSGGRLVLGVGLGIDFWREFSSFQGEAAGDAERAALLDDGIEIITRLWSGEPTTYRGTRSSVDGAQFLPRPVQQPRIPIWSAMIWPAAHPGPVRRAARCDGVMPFTGAAMTPAEAAAVHDAVARERGTDAPFDVCVWGEPDQTAAYEQAGVTWLVASAGPDESLVDVRRMVSAGPPRGNTVT
jgi:alkanesulfonate monooxygenase SsuD/methylene tetrahydromethanopterin reductase-like flavin-dependent oxidoreductase (luciferase family)